MPLRIVRNDISKMNTEAIVNTANPLVAVGTGCDSAVYKAAGYDELLEYRKNNIGEVPQGEAFITPGFKLKAKYIIHAVSPLYMNGDMDEELKLRSCYRKSLALAKDKGIQSISFPLISTGGFGYPKEEGMRIAVDEINAFLLGNDMEINLLVFDDESVRLGERINPDLDEYIDNNYVSELQVQEYERPRNKIDGAAHSIKLGRAKGLHSMVDSVAARLEPMANIESEDLLLDFDEEHESKLKKRIEHLSDTFSEYLLFLIQDKGLTNADVYKRAIVDKKVFSKLKNNPDYHPQKLTAMCLCVGAMLNLDETKDLLARAGYALSPCDKTDIIFLYFIENEIYDMIELDIQLEEHGLPCIIS